MSVRLRPIQFIVTPVVVADDGETLTNVQVEEQVVNAADFGDFPAKFAEALAQREVEINAPDPIPREARP